MFLSTEANVIFASSSFLTGQSNRNKDLEASDVRRTFECPIFGTFRQRVIKLAIALIFLLGFTGLKANEYISYSYGEERLIDIIEDLEDRYDLQFVYDREKVPTNQRLSARSGLVELDVGLQQLFEGTAIEYRRRDLRVLLRFNRDLAQEMLSAREAELSRRRLAEAEALRQREAAERATAPPAEVPTTTDLGYTEEEFASLPPPPPLLRSEDLQSSNRLATQDSTYFRGNDRPRRRKDQLKQRRLGQFSLLPGVGTNGGQPRNYINSISFNFPAGISGGLNGAEVGLVFNGVDGEAVGTQIGLGVNYVSQRLTGVQLSGGFNIIGLGEGVQIAGIANLSRRSLNGVQLAGLINFTRNDVQRQYSLGANISGGQVKRQIGLVNFASEATRGQIGLVNVADTIGGRSFGLINIVRKGYNVIEISRDMTQAWSANLKLGSYRFYNIFEVSGGFRSLNRIDEEGRTRQPVWSLGYGFGWKNRGADDYGPLRTSSEFVISHQNRGGRWTDRLNLFLHFRHTWDHAINSGQAAIFFGPTLALHWTQLSDEELERMQPWNTHLFKERYDKIRFSAMIGLRFGVRLGQL